MKKTLCLLACSGIAGFILATIERQAGWDLGVAPYFGIGAVFALIDIATDIKD